MFRYLTELNTDGSSDASEDKNYEIKNVKGHVTITGVKGNSNTTNVTVTGDIKVNEDILSKLEPEFRTSITDLKNQLDSKLKEHGGFTQGQINVISETIDKLAKDIVGIKADGEIADEEKKDDIKTRLRNFVEALVDAAPDVAESIASVTPLAPVSKAIGKGVEYVSALIKKKLSG
jgi:hypothetical protein